MNIYMLFFQHMILITLPTTLRLLLGIGFMSLLSSCGTSHSPFVAPSVSTMPNYMAETKSDSFRKSTNSATRVIVKTGSLNMDTPNVRETCEQIEQVVTTNGGHILSLNERDDKHQSASYSLRIPAHNLISSMDEIAELGKVTYRRVTVTDETKKSIAQRARLNKLKQRRKRLQAIYYNAKELSDKLDVEKTLADLEEEIFSIEEGIRELAKFSHYSKLEISLSQKTIRGPVGLAIDGLGWTWGKLFTIRE